jgi:hypothetical protein
VTAVVLKEENEPTNEILLNAYVVLIKNLFIESEDKILTFVSVSLLRSGVR